MSQIILITKGTGGDIFPFIAIGRALQTQGNIVTLFTHCVYENLAQEAGLAFIPVDSFAEYSQMRQEDGLLLQPHSALLFHRRHVLPRILDEYQLIKNQIQDQDALIVSHVSTLFTALIIGQSLKIPVVLTLLSPYQIKMLSFFSGLLGVLANEYNLLRNSLALPSVANWNLWLRSSQTTIGLWPDWLVSTKPDWPTDLNPVGFVLEQPIAIKDDELPKEVGARRAENKPCVLITHGTSLPLAPTFFETSIEACLALGYTVLVVTPYPELIPDCPPQIRWFKSLPFGKIFPYVDAIIHHGGIGTAAQALYAGKPQLIMGHGFDRAENGILFQRLGVAKFLPHTEWKSDKIAVALQCLMTSHEVQQQCLEWTRRASGKNSLTAACNSIETTKAGPTSTTSIANLSSKHLSDSDKVIEQRATLAALSSERREFLAFRLKQKRSSK